MSEASEAAEQVVKMMLSSGEIVVRLSGSAIKNGSAFLLALAKNHKKVFGRLNLSKMLGMTRDIRTFTLTPAQFQQFRKRARKMGILYSAVQDKNNSEVVIDLVLPVTEIERANAVFEQIRFTPEQENMTEQHNQGKEREPKNASRSEPDSRATRDSSSTWNEKTKMTNDRPSVEQKLKENKAVLEKKQRQAPARQKTRKKSKGKSK